MGSKSSPSQQSSNTNTSVSYGLQDSTGIFGNQNQITYNMTDGGLVNGVTDIASEVFNALRGLSSDMTRSVSDGFNLSGRVIDGAEYTVSEVIDLSDRLSMNNTALARDVVESNSDLARNVVSSSSDLARSAINSGNDLAREFGAENAALAKDSMSFGRDLMESYMAELSRNNRDSTEAIINTNRYALQFADNMSRSDGQQFAVDANKTMLYVLLGFAGLGAVAIIATRG